MCYNRLDIIRQHSSLSICLTGIDILLNLKLLLPRHSKSKKKKNKKKTNKKNKKKNNKKKKKKKKKMTYVRSEDSGRSCFSCFCFCPIWHCDHLAWGTESWCICFSCICLFMYALLPIAFSYSWYHGLAAVCECGTPFTLHLTFYIQVSWPESSLDAYFAIGSNVLNSMPRELMRKMFIPSCKYFVIQRD